LKDVQNLVPGVKDVDLHTKNLEKLLFRWFVNYCLNLVL
jgi:hypothetical protein